MWIAAAFVAGLAVGAVATLSLAWLGNCQCDRRPVRLEIAYVDLP